MSMAVYVGDIEWKFRNMIMFHMMADTEQELMEMVDKIGVQRKWFQHHKGSYPHFDICKSKKVLALKNGAIELSDREMVVKFKHQRIR
jgi:hypothetical protein